MKVIKSEAVLSRHIYIVRCKANDCGQRTQLEANAPRPRRCPACASEAIVVIEGKEYGRPDDSSTHRFTCRTCARAAELTVDFAKPEPFAARPCPGLDCEGEMVIDYTPQQLNRYGEVWTSGGYYNKGLGMHVTSEADLHQKADAMGLVPVEGDLDIERWCSDTRASYAEEDAEAAVHQQRLQDDPAFAAYRRATDQGQFDDPEASDDDETITVNVDL